MLQPPKETMNTCLRTWLVPLTALLAMPTGRAVEETWVFAVQVIAAVQADPARVELGWRQDSHPVIGYTVHRKAPGDAPWGNGVEIPASAASYVDETVTLGSIYEYQIVKQATYPYNGPAYNGFG
jgi:hypothetical protein